MNSHKYYASLVRAREEAEEFLASTQKRFDAGNSMDVDALAYELWWQRTDGWDCVGDYDRERAEKLMELLPGKTVREILEVNCL